MSKHPDILIVGGGVIGLSTAWRLAKRGVLVTVVDRQSIGQEASWAGAGMLPPGNLQNAVTPEARLRSYSHSVWESVTAELLEQTGIDNGYRRCGAVEIGLPDASKPFGEQLTEWQAEGIQVQLLDRPRLQQFVPDLHPALESGAFLPDFCQVRNPRHVKALAAACRQLGVKIYENVENLALVANAGIVTATASKQRFLAERVCVTAGAWSQQILAALNVPLPVTPVRGQIAQLRVSRLPFSCVIEQERRYLVPRPDGLILVGATEEYVDFEKRTTCAGVAGLLNFAESLVPELRQAELLRCWAGLRPGSPDELPFLGRVPEFENLFVGAGHFRSGVQMSTGTAQVLADVLLDREPAISLRGFEFGRTA